MLFFVLPYPPLSSLTLLLLLFSLMLMVHLSVQTCFRLALKLNNLLHCRPLPRQSHSQQWDSYSTSRIECFTYRLCAPTVPDPMAYSDMFQQNYMCRRVCFHMSSIIPLDYLSHILLFDLQWISRLFARCIHHTHSRQYCCCIRFI